MNRKLRELVSPSRLYLVLVQYILISTAIAVIGGLVAVTGLSALTGVITDRKAYYQKHIGVLVEDFQNFVTENDISAADSEEIGDWNLGNWYVFLVVYKDNVVSYNSGVTDMQALQTEPRLALLFRHDNSLAYPVTFADGEGSILIRAYFEAKFQSLIQVASIAVGAVLFIITFLLLFRKKLGYIRQIENGIQVLENGSREYQIPEKGRDELYILARSINQMSESLQEEVRQKDMIQQEKQDMVTALSHDMRTPLTSVLFYLDLIADKRYQAEQLEEYVGKARKQAYHMKQLMEDLLAFSYSESIEKPMMMEEYDGHELMGQLLAELNGRLEEKGYQAELKYDIQQPFLLRADVFQLKRVFDNLESNVVKYARKDAPVYMALTLADCACGNDGAGGNGSVVGNSGEDNNGSEQMIKFTQENSTRESDVGVESYGVGIKTAERIISKHGGRMEVSSGNYQFKICIYMPYL